MATPVRIQRLQARIKERASSVILHELNDPRLGFITLTKVKLTRDLSFATIYYSMIGSDGEKSRTQNALEHAAGFIQREIGKILRTRITPVIDFKYDISIEGSVRVSRLLCSIKEEREAQEEKARAAAQESETLESADENREEQDSGRDPDSPQPE